MFSRACRLKENKQSGASPLLFDPTLIFFLNHHIEFNGNAAVLISGVPTDKDEQWGKSPLLCRLFFF